MFVFEFVSKKYKIYIRRRWYEKKEGVYGRAKERVWDYVGCANYIYSYIDNFGSCCNKIYNGYGYYRACNR